MGDQPDFFGHGLDTKFNLAHLSLINVQILLSYSLIFQVKLDFEEMKLKDFESNIGGKAMYIKGQRIQITRSSMSIATAQFSLNHKHSLFLNFSSTHHICIYISDDENIGPKMDG